MPSIYGVPAIEVEQPGGEILLYTIRAVPAPPGVWRSWTVTNAEGDTYTVSEYPNGRWACTCPHWKYRGRFKCLPGGAYSDKHINSVRAEVESHGRPQPIAEVK